MPASPRVIQACVIQACVVLAVLTLTAAFVGAQATTWTGAASNDWFTAANWSAGVPTGATDATIPAAPTRQPSVGAGAAQCQALTVATGASLSIGAGKLTAIGAVANAGTINVTTGTLELTTHFDNTGTFSAGTGTVLFSATGSKNLKMGGAVFHDINITEGLVNAFGTVNAQNLTVGVSGAINFSIFNHAIAATCSLSGGVTGTGVITLSGTGVLTTGLSPLPNVTVTGGVRTVVGAGAMVSQDLTLVGGTTKVASGLLAVVGNLGMQPGAKLEISGTGVLDVFGTLALGGTVTMSGGQVICRGAWTSDATFAPTGGTVVFVDSAADVTAPGSRFADVLFLPHGTKTLKSALDVNGKLTVGPSATVDLGAFRHTLAGGLESWGTLLGTGVLEMDGTGVLTVSPQILGTVEITAGTLSVQAGVKVTTMHVIAGTLVVGPSGRLEVQGAFTVDSAAAAGTTAGAVLDLRGPTIWNGGSVSTGGVIEVRSNWTSGAGFKATAGEVELLGSGATLTSAGAFHHLSLTSGTWTAATALDVNAGFEVAGGTTFVTGGLTHAVSGDLEFAGTAGGNGVLRMDGAGGDLEVTTSVPAVEVAAGLVTVKNTATVGGALRVLAGGRLRLAKGPLAVGGAVAVASSGILDVSGGTLTVSGALDTAVGGTLTLSAGTIDVSGAFRTAAGSQFSLAGGALVARGNVTLGSVLTATGGRVELAGSTAATVTGTSSTLPAVDVTGTGKVLANAFTIVGRLAVATGAGLDLGAFTHPVQGGLLVDGTVSGAGQCDLSGTGGLAASGTLPRLLVSGGPIAVSTLAVIGGKLSVSAGGRVDVGAGGDLRVGGAVQWDGSYACSGGVLRVDDDLSVTGTLFRPAAGRVILSPVGAADLDAPDAIFQTLEVGRGAVRLVGGKLAFDQTLEVSGGTLTVPGGAVVSPLANAKLTVQTGATLRLHGDSWANPVSIAGRNAGRWSFLVKGTLGLRYFTLTDLDSKGLELSGGDFEVDPDLGNGSFDVGTPGGAYVTVSGFTATRTLENVWFKSNPGSAANNVACAGTTGKLVLLNALGVFKGAAHENDANNRVDWTLGPVPGLRLTEILQDTPRAVEVTVLDQPVDLENRLLTVGKAGGTVVTFTLAARVLQPGDWVELREGTGASSPNREFLGANLPLTAGAGGFAALANGAAAGIDFVRWGGSTRPPPAGTAFDDARGSLPAPATGQSLARDLSAADTDTREDWEPGSGKNATYPTPGARNVLYGLPWVWHGGETPNPFTPEAGSGSLWHLETNKRYFNPSKLKHEAGPPPDVIAWAFNRGTPAYDYNTGQRVSGAFRSPPVRLPVQGNLNLTYYEWLATENAAGKDLCTVEVRPLGASTWTQLVQYTGVVSTFAVRTIDVSAHQGQDVEFRWTFDSVDAANNAFEGWYVDYLAVWQGTGPVPFLPPESNQPPPPPGSESRYPRNRGSITTGWASNVHGAAAQAATLRLAIAGPAGLGIEVKTGLFAVRQVPAAQPNTSESVVKLLGLPAELDALVQGKPYPEFRFALPTLPGFNYIAQAVDVHGNRLPIHGMPGAAPDLPAAEVLPATAQRGPVLVVRPFGRDSKQNELSVQRHTIRLLLQWLPN